MKIGIDAGIVSQLCYNRPAASGGNHLNSLSGRTTQGKITQRSQDLPP
jgi:hypothetical protein